MSKAIGAVLILALFIGSFWTVYQSQQEINECKDTPGYFYSSECLNYNQYRDEVVSILEKQQPLSTENINGMIDLDYSQTQDLLYKMRSDQIIYESEEDGLTSHWKLLEEDN